MAPFPFCRPNVNGPCMLDVLTPHFHSEGRPTFSIVTPAFNEAEGLTGFHDRAPRDASQRGWKYRKPWNFTVEGIPCFTVMPLKIATWFSVTIASLSGIFGARL